ncbi:hypothetical protein [Falsiroseomonas bella]|uniref:hypothetical protein n=1 Tax=Falsiroseomonas bella TaxID=2184016 RepID=UPI001304D596|nr:hypothetical protein [Falsiroseomonas bella]
MPDASLRLQRGAEHLAELGPRAIAEFLAEIGAAHGIGDDIAARLDIWRRLRPAMLRAVLQRFAGGRSFPARLAVAPR